MRKICAIWPKMFSTRPVEGGGDGEQDRPLEREREGDGLKEIAGDDPLGGHGRHPIGRGNTA